MIVNKVYQGNNLSFDVKQSDNGKLSVSLVELNGEACTSKRMFRASRMKSVEEWLRRIKPDLEFLQRYNVHERIEPNKPKRRTVIMFKSRLLHLRKYNPATGEFRRIGISSYFANELRKRMIGLDFGIDYDIELGGVRNVTLRKEDLPKAQAEGLVMVDIAKFDTRKGANGRSKKVLKAQLKTRK